jgi:hypothetical protein
LVVILQKHLQGKLQLQFNEIALSRLRINGVGLQFE